ncbi:MAG: IS110 family transposase [Chitinophagaceae bacterium]
MSKVTVFKTVHDHAAGIDVGAAKIFVSVDGTEVKSFDTFTSGYYECAEYLQQKGNTEVAMEATGVYWMALYAMLESCGIKVCLVNPKETKQVKGRKTDVADCRWIQKLFSAGLLRQSFIPEGKYMEVRQLVRERLDIIDMGSVYVNKMQKCLELMNIKVKEVISQVHGTSGIKMIKAIIGGNRDKKYLLSLCDKRIINKKGESILKALEANYNDTYLFMLEQNLHMWEKHQDQLTLIDKEIEKLLAELCKTKQEVEVKSKAKLIRHHAPEIKNLHAIMVQMYGMNVSSVSGINDYTLLRLMGETGINMSRFPNVKHFVSWCGLSPKHHDSGKTKKRVKATSCNKAGQIFKESAQGLLNSKYVAIGSFMRKLKARKDSAIAIKAGARKLAEAYFNALTKGIDYVEQGTKKYEEQIIQREKTALYRLAKKHNMQVTEKQQAA